MAGYSAVTPNLKTNSKVSNLVLELSHSVFVIIAIKVCYLQLVVCYLRAFISNS